MFQDLQYKPGLKGKEDPARLEHVIKQHKRCSNHVSQIKKQIQNSSIDVPSSNLKVMYDMYLKTLKLNFVMSTVQFKKVQCPIQKRSSVQIKPCVSDHVQYTKDPPLKLS